MIRSNKEMSLFGQSSFGQPSAFGGSATSALTSTSAAAASAANPMKDIEVISPPDDSVSCLRFSPSQSPTASNFLVAGSWDNNVRCWEIKANGQSEPKTQQSMQVSIGAMTNVARQRFSYWYKLPTTET